MCMCVIASALMNEVGVTAGSVELEKMRQQCCNCQQSNRGTNAPTRQRSFCSKHRNGGRNSARLRSRLQCRRHCGKNRKRVP